MRVLRLFLRKVGHLFLQAALHLQQIPQAVLTEHAAGQVGRQLVGFISGKVGLPSRRGVIGVQFRQPTP